MRLSDLLDGFAGLREVIVPDASTSSAPFDAVEVVDIVLDHRRVVPGSMFACYRGRRVDGHDFAPAAIAAGATVLLVERPIDVTGIASGSNAVTQLVVSDVRAFVGPLAARLQRDPSRTMDVIGITGTNGKTSVAHLVGAIAAHAGRNVGILGTLGARWSRHAAPGAEHDEPTGFTTPEAPALQLLFAAMRDDGVQTVAMEVSSHALDQHRVDGTKFAAVAFTNLSAEHLDLHGDLDTYFEAKARLFGPEFAGRAVVCVDDAFGERLADLARARGIETITVSTVGRAATAQAVNIETRRDGIRFVLRHADSATALPIELALLGRFNVANAAVAAVVSELLGITSRDIAAGLANAPRVPGRLELVENAAGFTVVVDYAHTPDALATVLANLRDLAPEPARLIAVYGCGGDRDRSKRGPMGHAVASGANVAILTNDNPRSEAPAAIVADVIAGLAATDLQPEVVLDRRAAIARALDLAEPGDVVLIAGKGHESGQTSQGITVAFDDRTVAAELLTERGWR